MAQLASKRTYTHNVKHALIVELTIMLIMLIEDNSTRSTLNYQGKQPKREQTIVLTNAANTCRIHTIVKAEKVRVEETLRMRKYDTYELVHLLGDPHEVAGKDLDVTIEKLLIQLA